MKIAVVLAHNWMNTGMYSVDLAAFRFFEESGYLVNYFVASGARPNSLFKSGQVPIYSISDSSAFDSYDKVVYWGEFTTSPAYGLSDFHDQLNAYDGPITRKTTFKYWMDIFLLGNQKTLKHELFSFGQNFQTFGAVASKIDLKSVARLYGRFSTIMPRDTVSTSELRAHFPSIPAASLVQGCDPAFLLPDSPAFGVRSHSKRIGIFLSRSKIENKIDLVKELTNRGHELVFLNQWLSLPRNTMHENYLAFCNSIRECGSLLTDTYHLAVNSIRLGTTPIVLGLADPAQTSSVSDFKKRVMLRDLEAEDLFVPLTGSRLSPEIIGSIADFAGATANRSTTHPVHERSRHIAELAASEFRRIVFK